jgi:hypothetical protein
MREAAIPSGSPAKIAGALPYPCEFSRAHLALVIDMQRDFIEPGGFGSAFGNEVGRLGAIVPDTARLLAGFRLAGLRACPTKEAHRPDLSDCPPAKLRRGNPGLRIGDPGPMRRIRSPASPATISSPHSINGRANRSSRNPATAPSLPPGSTRCCASGG